MKFELSIFTIALTIYVIHNAAGLPTPRDNTAVISEQLPTNKEVLKKDDSQIPVGIPTRVPCQNADEEPTVEEICQTHCIPKGYSYGLCFRSTCTCI